MLARSTIPRIPRIPRLPRVSRFARLARLARLARPAALGRPVARLSIASLVALVLPAGALLGGAGCASILGFDDTTLRAVAESDGGNDGSIAPVDGAVAGDGAVSRLTPRPAAVAVRRGKNTTLMVDLVRGADAAGPVTLRLSDLPAGVTATSVTLAPQETTGSLKLSALRSATLGTTSITLTADGTRAAPVTLSLMVSENPGAFDTTFNADGLVAETSAGAGATFLALAVQPDGRIVAGGARGATPDARSGWLVRRYGADGAPDVNFAAAPSGAPTDGELRAIAIDAMGRITCAGSSTEASDPTLLMTLVRWLPSGALDSSFAGGVVRVPVTDTPTGSVGLGVAVDTDGTVVVVGTRRETDDSETGLIARFLANGTRDAAFNGGESVAIPSTRLVGVSPDVNHAVVAAGSTTAGALPSFYVTRRTAAGASDPTFGTGGTSTFGNTFGASGFARLSDGHIALVGSVEQQGAGAYVVGIASPLGAAVVARSLGTAPAAGLFGVAAEGPARLVLAGHTATANGEARVERLFSDGGADPSFGDGGVSFIDEGGAGNDFDITLYAAAVQADGRILVAGNHSKKGAALYRLWP